jgi:hypothetical protein
MWWKNESDSTVASQAMDLAEMAEVAKLRGDLINCQELFRQAFAKETEAASLLVNM